jgi:hypothetical protein
MDVVTATSGLAVETVDPLLREALAWVDRRQQPEDRDDPLWLYSYVDVVRVCDAVQRGRR